MRPSEAGEAAKAVVRRSTVEVPGGGDWAVFEKLFADDFWNTLPARHDAGQARVGPLYGLLREAFSDFRADIHCQAVDGDAGDGDLGTTYKIYYGKQQGRILGVTATGRQVHFETVDAIRVRDEKIINHWREGNLISLMQQFGALPHGPEIPIADSEQQSRGQS